MTYKIWFQGATDKVHMAPYIAKVEAHLKAVLDPDFSATFHTTTPPATTTHAITEFRIARNLAIDHHRRQVLRPVAAVDVNSATRPANQDTAAAAQRSTNFQYDDFNRLSRVCHGTTDPEVCRFSG